MPRETSPGLKILWLWTIGTAGILVTSVMRTRLRDMEQQLTRTQEQEATPNDSIITDVVPESEGFLIEDRS
ncbi:hypothetical protein CK203_022465 [Vitis vinifera]|uniref:Uncharacterized protein n=1 Tax=Vitis vinifera TaxID=29760 RepID=A0A438JE16_VITVI|nr:hypothetical protein CK203_079019 [Vitis vinifera]RVX07193.1 hypothetical protein CK203_022465 [Vitis vinifera]